MAAKPYDPDPLSDVDFDAQPKLVLNADGELVVAPTDRPTKHEAPKKNAALTDDLALPDAPEEPEELGLDFLADEGALGPMEEGLVVAQPEDPSADLELTEDDVVETNAIPVFQHLMTADLDAPPVAPVAERWDPTSDRSRVRASVTPVGRPAPARSPTPSPRRSPSVVGRQIRERNRSEVHTPVPKDPPANPRAEEFFTRGLAALEADDLVNAERDLAIALTYAPSNERYRAAFLELKRKRGRA